MKGRNAHVYVHKGGVVVVVVVVATYMYRNVL